MRHNVLSQEEKTTLLENIVNSPNFSCFLNDFSVAKSNEEKSVIYKQFPLLKDAGLSKKRLSKLIDDFHSTEDANLNKLIVDSINNIIENQDKEDGSWAVIQAQELEKIITSKCYDNLMVKYTPESKIANPWSNALLTLILIKAKLLYNQKYYEFKEDYNDDLAKQVDNSIERSIRWINSQKQNSNKNIGWSPCPKDICSSGECEKSNINTYDTSFVISTLVGSVNELYNKLQDIPINTLISPALYDKNKGAWLTNQAGATNFGATAYAIIALKKYSDKLEEPNVIKYKVKIKKGIEWLLINQNKDGGWASINNEDETSRIDTTCVALQALIREGYNYNKDIAIVKGFDFLQKKRKTLDYGGAQSLNHTKLFLWDTDSVSDMKKDTNSKRIRNTSLAISTLLKGGMSYYDPIIKNSLISLLKIHNNKGYNIKDSFDSAYFYCTLIDYLRFAQSSQEI